MKLMKNKIHIIYIFSFLLLPSLALAYSSEFGFWSGLWHGISFPFRIFLKLIWTDITIYEQFDSTYWYHVGYLIGALGILGGASSR